MASQGQRFRRKALRRGYKVDEVDAFLDRVEATLAGQPVGAPVASQEVHDVVFRVRFNGYDEWQVDLHLDRVERQLAELEERSAPSGRGADPRGGDRLAPPMRDDHRGLPQAPPPMSPRAMPAQPGPPDRYGSRYDEPTGAFAGGYDAPRGGYDAPRGQLGPGPGGPMGPGPGAPMGHGGPPPRGLPAGPGSGYGPPDEQRFDGFEAGRHGRADMTAEIRMPERDRMSDRDRMPERDRMLDRMPERDRMLDRDRMPEHDRMLDRDRMPERDRMLERDRMPERDPRDMRGRGPAGPPSMPPQPLGGPPMGGPPAPMGPPVGGPPMVGPPMVGPPGSELYRVDQIRRSFQVRRFGSGYDPDQVDRFFESLLGGMQGRNQMPVNPKDLDTLRFGLVPGGYFEAEVDAALKDVQDILFGR
ncbi:DivIVA domain-containing protein [Micromonospora sp. HM134]|uniref:DivIVA domain-containing protein n=1 Tax=Micromonospora sp. HM134 TaxID=2583243 RepID=UPI001198A71D|nr:DivIVA domain-containing protein [Micromonospora sp. HM134]QDY07040.1 DivIVA domain-containing protein [Micromonospora sp. HM134]